MFFIRTAKGTWVLLFHIFFSLFLLFPASALGAETSRAMLSLSSEKNQETWDLLPVLEIYQDKEGQNSMEQILAKRNSPDFLPFELGKYSYIDAKSIFWGHIKVKNIDHPNDNWQFILLYTEVSLFEIYVIKDEKPILLTDLGFKSTNKFGLRSCVKISYRI